MSQYAVTEVPQLVAPRDAARLQKAGLHSTEDVLRQGATAGGRKELARRTHIKPSTIERLARRADLLRLADVGPEHVLLLEAVGVKSMSDLAARDPTAVTAAAAAANRARKIVDLMPGQAQFRAWITQAKSLPPIIQD
jgi:predicted flap endonuclease-1-like 5' DNA nuclease